MKFRDFKREIKFLLFLIIIILLWQAGRYLPIGSSSLESFFNQIPTIYRGLIYICLYVGISFFIFFAKDVFWVIGALLFGPLLSALLICISETINAFLLFHLARLLGRGYVEKSLANRYSHLDERLSKVGFTWLFIFRAAPLIPYRFMDLAAGLTKISFRKYLLAVIIGSPVKIFWIQYVLSGVGKSILNNPYVLVEYFLNNKFFLFFSFIYIILVISVAIKISSKK